jgi:hypothetical protein
LRVEDATRMLPIIMLSARGEEVLRLRGFGRPSQTNGIPAARMFARGLGSSFLGSTYWSAFGGHLLTSPIERSMST